MLANADGMGDDSAAAHRPRVENHQMGPQQNSEEFLGIHP